MKIAAISGSIKINATTFHILRWLQENADVPVEIFTSLDQLPFFNPEFAENPPQAVKDLSIFLKTADAVIICTPEYAFGVPGLLKNGLDWLVSSAELYQKPVVTISASPSPSGGNHAHASLRLTLTAMGAELFDEGQLHIGYTRKKINASGKIEDDDLKIELMKLFQTLKNRAIKKS